MQGPLHRREIGECRDVAPHRESLRWICEGHLIFALVGSCRRNFLDFSAPALYKCVGTDAVEHEAERWHPLHEQLFYTAFAACGGIAESKRV